MNIQTATPKQIDTVLAEIHGRMNKVRIEIAQNARYTKSYRKGLVEKANGVGAYMHWTQEALDKLISEGAALVEKFNAISDETDPYDAEFTRRGGWSRFFLVQNHGGHIHSSMDCQTCNKRGKATEFGWLPEMSGMDEKTALESLREQGNMMCTVCFPSAPVGWDKPAEDPNKCPGSNTGNYDPSKSRTGYFTGNYGHCNECGQNVTIPGRSYSMKKHTR